MARYQLLNLVLGRTHAGAADEVPRPMDCSIEVDLRRGRRPTVHLRGEHAYPHVVELAGNPMQLAILLNLMQRRAVLPEKRTALYDRYIEVFMDRESKSSIVAANKDVIVSFHKLLGWYIHARIEVGKSNGTIGLGELRKLLIDYLLPRGYPTAFVNELFDSVTTRVLCLVQRELDSHEFQFEVQPLREYFAAEHLYDVSPNDTPKNNRQACLRRANSTPVLDQRDAILRGQVLVG